MHIIIESSAPLSIDLQLDMKICIHFYENALASADFRPCLVTSVSKTLKDQSVSQTEILDWLLMCMCVCVYVVMLQ